jgi:Cytochrome P460
MRKLATVSAAAFTGALLAATAAIQVKAGPELVKFPADYDKAVKYAIVSNPNNKLYREFYTPKEAVDAVKAGKPVPSGTWIVMKSFKSKVDPTGAPLKGADGHFVKDELAAYAVMEKRAGWGKEYPDALRNGEWEYQAFTAAKAVNDKANIKACFECHKPKASDDYLFTIGQMRAHK